MKLDRELLKGATATIVLSMLSECPAHGYELARRVRSRSDGLLALGEGTLYPLLYSLEDKGWVEGRWERGRGKRRRRVYRITPSGRGQLADRADQWYALAGVMELVLGGTRHAGT